MNVVTFPGLNLSFEFSKIAFTIFGISVYKYAVCIVLGIVVALVLCRLNKEIFGIDFEFILESSILGIFFGVIGARIYYIIFNLEYYINNPGEILNFRNGGLAIYGGLIFGALAIIINCRLQKKNILDFFDSIVPFVAIAQSIGRWGNFFNIEAYGYETNSLFRMGIATALGYIEVHPTFLYEAVSTLVIGIVLIIMQRKRKYSGQVLLLYCILYGLIRSFIETLRIDSLMFLNLRISQILSIIVLIISATILIVKNIKSKATVSKEK